MKKLCLSVLMVLVMVSSVWALNDEDQEMINLFGKFSVECMTAGYKGYGHDSLKGIQKDVKNQLLENEIDDKKIIKMCLNACELGYEYRKRGVSYEDTKELVLEIILSTYLNMKLK